MYLDPPYQGTSLNRDHRYFKQLQVDDLITALVELNRRKVPFILSYDGRLGDKTYGQPLPSYLDLTHLDVHLGRSSQSTLLGRMDETVESLYLSNHRPKKDSL